MKKSFLPGCLICLAILLLPAAPGHGALYHASEAPALFGDLSQQEPTLTAAYGDYASGPAAAVNAFVYLQNKFPTIYDASLVPGSTPADLAATALKLGGREYMSLLTPLQIYGLSNGISSSVFIKGKYAYVGSNTTITALKIFDISNPAVPVLVGSAGGYGIGNVNVIYVRGDYAFVGWNNSTIRIYNVDDKANPTEISTINYGYGQTLALYAGDNLLYVGTNTGALQEFRIYDISNILAPSLISATDVGGDLFSFYFRDQYAYLGTAAFSRDFQIYDVSDPLSPVSVSSANVGPVVLSVYLQGKYAYLGLNNGASRFQIYDVSDPALPAPVAAVATPTEVHELTVPGRYAYLAMGGQNAYPALAVYDVSNPAAPVLVGSSANSVDVNGLAVSGWYAYLATGTGDPVSFRAYSLNHTYFRDFIWGVNLYTRPTNTAYGGQTVPQGTYSAANAAGWGWNKRVRPPWVSQSDTLPTWNFIYNQLKSGQALAVAFRGQDGTGKTFEHYLTVTGLFFNDINNNGVIEFDENAIISYIDPKDGQPYSTHLWQDATGRLFLYYYNYSYDWFAGNVQVEMALSLGPRAVTAPFLMLLLGE